jgi:hypothetical protein
VSDDRRLSGLKPIGKAGAKDDLLLTPPPATFRFICEGLESVNVELELAPLPLLPPCECSPSGNA